MNTKSNIRMKGEKPMQSPITISHIRQDEKEFHDQPT